MGSSGGGSGTSPGFDSPCPGGSRPLTLLPGADSWYEMVGEKAMATRVLLIDDDYKIVGLLERGLAFEGFEVITASDGEAGLEAARLSRPHVVLLDIAMPGPDGFEVCRRLRLVHDGPVIMLTARDDVVD